jgi:hypothetical protein
MWECLCEPWLRTRASERASETAVMLRIESLRRGACLQQHTVQLSSVRRVCAEWRGSRAWESARCVCEPWARALRRRRAMRAQTP